MIIYYISRILKKLKPVSKKNTVIHKTSRVEGGTQIINSSMDKYSFCGYDCIIENTTIGAFCSIAGNVKIGMASHPFNWVSTSSAFYYGRDSIKKNLARNNYGLNINTIIGNDVWIAENVLIKAGVKISDGAVIALGSVLTHDVGAYEIWGGNPAQFIKKRFDEKTINKLITSKWWDESDERLYELSENIDNPQAFIKSL